MRRNRAAESAWTVEWDLAHHPSFFKHLLHASVDLCNHLHKQNNPTSLYLLQPTYAQHCRPRQLPRFLLLWVLSVTFFCLLSGALLTLEAEIMTSGTSVFIVTDLTSCDSAWVRCFFLYIHLKFAPRREHQQVAENGQDTAVSHNVAQQVKTETAKKVDHNNDYKSENNAYEQEISIVTFHPDTSSHLNSITESYLSGSSSGSFLMYTGLSRGTSGPGQDKGPRNVLGWGQIPLSRISSICYNLSSLHDKSSLMCKWDMRGSGGDFISVPEDA